MANASRYLRLDIMTDDRDLYVLEIRSRGLSIHELHELAELGACTVVAST